MDGFSPSNQDFLSEYRSISGKLKKYVLKIPRTLENSQFLSFQFFVGVF